MMLNLLSIVFYFYPSGVVVKFFKVIPDIFPYDTKRPTTVEAGNDFPEHTKRRIRVVVKSAFQPPDMLNSSDIGKRLKP